jgi:hypothetical protein
MFQANPVFPVEIDAIVNSPSLRFASKQSVSNEAETSISADTSADMTSIFR